MVGFIIGLLSGGFVGICVMCLCNAASKADSEMENRFNNNDESNLEQ